MTAERPVQITKVWDAEEYSRATPEKRPRAASLFPEGLPRPFYSIDSSMLEIERPDDIRPAR